MNSTSRQFCARETPTDELFLPIAVVVELAIEHRDPELNSSQLVWSPLPMIRHLLNPRFYAVMILVGLFAGGNRAAGDAPNVLIVMADDCTHNDLALYGGKNALTPNIDRLATQGLTFNHAYLSEAMCQPCRAELYSGQFPLRNGCVWNHSASRPQTKSIPQMLGARGYRVGIAGKIHVKPASAFPFEKVGGFDQSCVRNPTKTHDMDGLVEFITRSDTTPFCLVVALVEPHVPWVMGDPSEYPSAKIELPPNIADTPMTRDAFSRYLAEITYMDGQVGEILETLKRSGKADTTLVLFTSEQGSQFPGCKWTNWDTGLHTALIARWPGTVPAGKRTSALVHYADVLPTLLDFAGGTPDNAAFDGRSFRHVLEGRSDQHRQFVYGIHNNVPEGPAYPIRTISDGQYRYIRNLKPAEIYIEKHLMGWTGDGKLNNPYWATWVSGSWNNAQTYTLVKRYMHRPAEQLYETKSDPFELTNLANDADLAVVRDRMAAELDRFLVDQRDPGIALDSLEAINAARRGKHTW
jgi:uncharacterized sulfatase